jgi:hypothetical protein
MVKFPGLPGLARLVLITHAHDTPESFAATVEGSLATARHPRFGVTYPSRVPLDEAVAGLLPTGWVSGFHYVGWWNRVHEGVCRGQLRRPPEPGYRQQLADKGPPGVTFAQSSSASPISTSPAMVPASPMRSAGSLVDGPSSCWAVPTATPRCSGTLDDPSLNVPLHHNDSTRAYAYDRESLSGKLERCLEECERRG